MPTETVQNFPLKVLLMNGLLRASKPSRSVQVHWFGRLTEQALFLTTRIVVRLEQQDVLSEDGASFARVADVRDRVEEAKWQYVPLNQSSQSFGGDLHAVEIEAVKQTKNRDEDLVRDESLKQKVY